MTPRDETRSGANSRKDAFDGRDLLVGRPERAEANGPSSAASRTPPSRPAPATAKSPPAGALSPQPTAHDEARDDAIAEILTTVRATAARIDALQDETGPAHETAEALAREAAALTQAVGDARGALARAAELAAGRDGAAEAARALAGAAAALKTQGEALDRRIRATDRQSAVAGHAMEDMNQSATTLNDQLRSLGNDLLRISHRLRWRHWRFGLAVAAASFIFFALGAVLQREADVISFGDPRHEWNDFVLEEFAPTIAGCASWARLKQETIRCRLYLDPSLDVTIPLYPEATVEEVPPDERAAPSAGQ